jgi:hypothetical protein
MACYGNSFTFYSHLQILQTQLSTVYRNTKPSVPAHFAYTAARQKSATFLTSAQLSDYRQGLWPMQLRKVHVFDLTVLQVHWYASKHLCRCSERGLPYSFGPQVEYMPCWMPLGQRGICAWTDLEGKWCVCRTTTIDLNFRCNIIWFLQKKWVSLTLNYLIYAVYYYNSEAQTKDWVKRSP